ncbi:MAG TPA: glycoside hydrolase family 3 N-terminal domain-containing protein [Gemmatimonadaceae bacterium]
MRPAPAPTAQPDADSSVYLFSYFTRNGDDGLHLAYSEDGIKWLPLNGARSFLRPAITGQGVGWMEWNTTAALMRDPCVLRGPDGVFHLVWTISWTDKAIGVAHSRDLIHWSPQKRVPVMEHEPTALNTWAPELFYDDESRQYLIFWATSIPGRFPASDSLAQKTPRGRADHRLYYVTTRDFETFSPTRLLYDGGFSAIDGTIKKSGDTYYLVMKDETFYPKPVRSLRVASSKHATGPYGPASAPFTEEDTEGPSILRTGDWWRVYYDRYTRGRYGAVRTRDFVHWERVTDSLDAPRGIRHGSAFLAPRSVLAGLLAMDSLKRSPTTNAPYRDPTRSIDERVRDLLSRMTLEEKFWQLYMTPGDLDGNDYSRGVFGLQVAEPKDTARPAAADADHMNALQRFFTQTRLGIPIIPFEEAVHGLRRAGGTMFPQAIGLAATFDTALMGRVATAIAGETRSRGIRQVLSPVINIANDVRWGRVEETYGEDPVLTSAMAVAYVTPFERAGVITTPKHFIANVGDGGRDSYPIQFSDRLLEEVFYPPFRAAIGAGARSVMSAYNSVDGLPATQNHHLLTDVLRDDWGFRGVVISDAAATGGATVLHHTEASTASATKHALESGLDVVFQSTYEQHRPYLDALQAGLVSDSVIDAAVSRVLRAKFGLGLFEHPFVNPDSASYWAMNAGHRALAADAARASIVLLQNRGGVLPLARTIGSVAVIGADATEARLGGYSALVAKPSAILDGVRAKVGGARVRFATGPGRFAIEHVVVPAEFLASIDSGKTVRGLRAEYFDNPALAGAPRLVRLDQRVDFGWTLNSPGRGIPFDWYSVRWTGTITAPANGARRLGVEGNDGYRLYLDGKLVVDDWAKRGYGANLANVDLAPGSTHQIRLEFFESTGNARIKLVWDAGVDTAWRTSIDSAVAATRASDAAIVVAGIEEGEFRDRAKLGLPGHQEELIDRVAATGKPVIVVLVGGSAITMPWLSRVSAVLDVWYPGEAGGDAVADVLWGDYNPAGRLPITFPVSEGQLPLVYNHKPTGRGDDYLDLTGQPLFPFGYGLSYTTFEYSNLSITPDIMSPAGQATVRFRVRNSGRRAGDEVAQLYVRDLLASVARPVIQLEGFQRVHLAPGEERELSFTVGRDQLNMLDAGMRWIVEPGTFRILVGASSKDIRLRGDLTIQ